MLNHQAYTVKAKCLYITFYIYIYDNNKKGGETLGKYKIPMRTLGYLEALMLGLYPEDVECVAEKRAKRKTA